MRPMISLACFCLQQRQQERLFRDSMQTWPLPWSVVIVSASQLVYQGCQRLSTCIVFLVFMDLFPMNLPHSHLKLLITVCLSSLLWQQVPEVHYSLWKVLLSELNQSPVSFTECALLLFLVLQILFCLILLACSYPLFPDSVNCDHTSFLAFPCQQKGPRLCSVGDTTWMRQLLHSLDDFNWFSLNLL